MYWDHLSKYHICTSWAVQQCAVEEPGRVNNFTTAPYRLTWTAAACRTAPARSTASAASTAATKTWPSLSQPKSARSASRWWRRWRWERARGRLRVLLAGQRILTAPCPFVFVRQTEYARLEGGKCVYRIHRSPMCEYMINFIHKLKHLPEKYMMNSVLENFTILQVAYICVDTVTAV